MAGVKRPPAVLQIHFEPGAEIHGRGPFRHTDIAQVSGGIAGGNIQRAAESDGQMLEIAADSGALGENVQGRLRRTRVLVAKRHLPVHPAADGLHAAPSRLQVAKQFDSDIRQPINLAVTAVQEIAQHLWRQLIYRMLLRVGIGFVGRPRVFNQRGTGEAQRSGGRKPPGATVAVAVDIALNLTSGLMLTSSASRRSATREGCTFSMPTIATVSGISN